MMSNLELASPESEQVKKICPKCNKEIRKMSKKDKLIAVCLVVLIFSASLFSIFCFLKCLEINDSTEVPLKNTRKFLDSMREKREMREILLRKIQRSKRK